MSERHRTGVFVDGANLVIALSWRDRAVALTGNQIVPLAAISSVEAVSDPLRGVSGVRSPGLAIPWATKVGVWRRRGHRTLVVVRRNQRAIRLRVVGQRFDSYLIGTDDANALQATIQNARDRL